MHAANAGLVPARGACYAHFPTTHTRVCAASPVHHEATTAGSQTCTTVPRCRHNHSQAPHQSQMITHGDAMRIAAHTWVHAPPCCRVHQVTACMQPCVPPVRNGWAWSCNGRACPKHAPHLKRHIILRHKRRTDVGQGGSQIAAGQGQPTPGSACAAARQGASLCTGRSSQVLCYAPSITHWPLLPRVWEAPCKQQTAHGPAAQCQHTRPVLQRLAYGSRTIMPS